MADYFVDNLKGDDDNDGLSRDAPWKTLDKASDTTGTRYVAGDKLSLARGGAYPGRLRLTGVGSKTSVSAANTITVTAHGSGPKPIFYGDGFTGPAEGVIELLNVGTIVVEDQDLRNGPNGLIHGALDTAIGSITIRRVDSKNNVHSGISIGTGALTAASSAGSFCTVEECFVDGFGEDGIDIFGERPQNALSNRVLNARGDTDEPKGDGISFHNSGVATITGNTVERCVNGIRNATNNTSVNVVSGNKIIDCPETGISGLDLLGNADLGTWKIFNNVILMPANGRVFEFGEGTVRSAIRFGDRVGFAGSDDWYDVKVWNNTIVVQADGVPAFYFKAHATQATGIDVRNNSVIALGDARFWELDRNGAASLTLNVDYNRYSGGNDLGRFKDGTSYYDLSGWASALSDEANSETEGEPSTVDRRPSSVDDTRPMHGTVMASTGADLTGEFTADADGKARSSSNFGVGAFNTLRGEVVSGRDHIVASKVESISTATVDRVTFSGEGDVIIVSSTSGSDNLFRIRTDGIDPKTTFTDEDESYMVSAGGDQPNARIELPESTSEVRITHDNSGSVTAMIALLRSSEL